MDYRFTARWESEIFWWRPAESRIWIFVFEEEERSSGWSVIVIGTLLSQPDHTDTSSCGGRDDIYFYLMSYRDIFTLKSVTRAGEICNWLNWDFSIGLKWGMMTINSLDKTSPGGHMGPEKRGFQSREKLLSHLYIKELYYVWSWGTHNARTLSAWYTVKQCSGPMWGERVTWGSSKHSRTSSYV